MIKQIAATTTLTMLMAGCVTVPAPQEGQTSYASYVGDRQTVRLEDIVVSMPGEQRDGSIRNLHIFLAATINPITKSDASEFHVQQIIERAGTRISADLVDAILAHRINTSVGLPVIKSQILEHASQTFETVYGKWAHADEYKVQLVVTSLFWTDGSVGKTMAPRFLW